MSVRLLKLIKLSILISIVLTVFTGCEGIIQFTNQPPVISSLTANPDTVEASHNTIITCMAIDQDDDQLTYKWVTTGGKISGSGSMVSWTAPAIADTYTVTCTVSDGRGGEDSQSVTVLVSGLNQITRPVVSIRNVNSVTYHLSSINKPSYRIIQDHMDITSKEIIPNINHTDLQVYRNEEIGYGVEFYWDNYPGVSGYKVYRSINGGDYKVVFKGIDYCCSCWCHFFDTDIQKGNIYFYYITAYGGGWETMPSEVFVIDTWLPSCSLITPHSNEVINNPNPIFTCSSVGLYDFPYGSISFGATVLFVVDNINDKVVWQRYFDHDLTVSSIIYNDSGDAIPLVSGHTYAWWLEGHGYDEDINLIAISYSDYKEFTYVGE